MMQRHAPRGELRLRRRVRHVAPPLVGGAQPRPQVPHKPPNRPWATTPVFATGCYTPYTAQNFSVAYVMNGSSDNGLPVTRSINSNARYRWPCR